MKVMAPTILSVQTVALHISPGNWSDFELFEIALHLNRKMVESSTPGYEWLDAFNVLCSWRDTPNDCEKTSRFSVDAMLLHLEKSGFTELAKLEHYLRNHDWQMHAVNCLPEWLSASSAEGWETTAMFAQPSGEMIRMVAASSDVCRPENWWRLGLLLGLRADELQVAMTCFPQSDAFERREQQLQLCFLLQHWCKEGRTVNNLRDAFKPAPEQPSKQHVGIDMASEVYRKVSK